MNNPARFFFPVFLSLYHIFSVCLSDTALCVALSEEKNKINPLGYVVSCFVDSVSGFGA